MDKKYLTLKNIIEKYLKIENPIKYVAAIGICSSDSRAKNSTPQASGEPKFIFDRENRVKTLRNFLSKNGKTYETLKLTMCFICNFKLNIL